VNSNYILIEKQLQKSNTARFIVAQQNNCHLFINLDRKLMFFSPYSMQIPVVFPKLTIAQGLTPC
jgi:hypothetical protein